MPQPKATSWYVLTGAPSSGKTSVCLNLAYLGYRFCPESARLLIDRELSRGITLDEIRKDNLEFQRRVLGIHVRAEETLPPLEKVFLDRAVFDAAAYGLPLPEVMPSYRFAYAKIFFMEQVGFKKDYARTEDEVRATQIGERVVEAYSEQGYEIVRVPKMSIEERTEFILNEIN